TDDEQAGLWVQGIQRGAEVGRVQVGDEVRFDARGAVGAQRGSRHRGTQVGSPDTDVHDLLDGSPGDTQPSTTAQVAAEVSHPTEDFVDVCGDVHPVDLEILVHRDAQRGVQGGTVLGGVDRSP